MSTVALKFIEGIGQPNGLAPLDGSGVISAIYLPGGTLAKFMADTSWNGTDTTKTVTVSGLADAREAAWQLLNNTDDFARIFCSIKAISSTQIQIDVSPALPSGNYRLVGVG
jgi:hypothetical protein